MNNKVLMRGLLLMVTLFYMPGTGIASATPGADGQPASSDIDSSNGSEARRPTAIRG